MDLQSLIAKAKAEVKAKSDLAAAKTNARKAKTTEARAEAESEALAIQATIDWIPTYLVYRSVEWRCANCDSFGYRPDGLYIHFEHSRMANTHRLARPRHESEIPRDLPKRKQYASEVAIMCGSCAPAQGFEKEYFPPPPRVSTPAQRGEGPYLTEWRTKTTPLLEEDDDTSPL